VYFDLQENLQFRNIMQLSQEKQRLGRVAERQRMAREMHDGLGLRSGDGGAPAATAPAPARPLRLREALGVAALLLGVSVLVSWLQGRFGLQGVWAGTALAALVDAHAPLVAAYGLHAQGRLAADAALQTTLVALGVNSLSRCGVAFAAGGAAFGSRVASTLIVSAAAAGGALWVGLPPAAAV